MTHRYIKIGVTSAVLVAAFVGLLWATLRDGTEYYKHVDEVMSSPQQWEGKRLQIHGYVVPGSVYRLKDSSGNITLNYGFKIQNKGSVVQASYFGVVPDTFKDNSEVVLKGRLDGATFHTDPNGVMAKCPSKYEAAKSTASAGS